MLSKSSYKAEDIITFLEKKLANLRKLTLNYKNSMSVTAVKEAFEEIPTRAQSALDTQWAYYKLSLFRFIAKSAIGLITFSL